MITLTTYHWVPDFAAPLMRAFRVRWALEEAGLPYEVRTVTLGPEQRSRDHLQRQPFGQAPAIEEGGLVLFESGAIAHFIAEQSENLLPTEPARRARAIAWMFAALNSVENSIQELAGIDLFHADEDWAKARRPQVEESVRDRLKLLESALGKKPYLEGEFTVGDLMMADVLRILNHTDVLASYPALATYKTRCEQRPAFQRAMTAQLAGFVQAA
jgi:glutathione S-transferase